MTQLAYRWLWLRCLFAVLAARIAVQFAAAHALRQALQRSRSGRDPTTPEEWQRLHMMGLAAATAGVWVTDRRRPCLPVALATQRLAARLGYRAVLRLGVVRGEGILEAHAWVECGGRCIVGQSARELAPMREPADAGRPP